MPPSDASETATLTADFAAMVRHLERRLAEPLPGTDAQILMAMDYRQNTELASVEGRDCREAGVLALFYPDEERGRPVLVLTERHLDLDDHGGQISFPGGQREAGESLRDAALREAHEEVALDPQAVNVLGRLTPLYIPPSNFCVHPFVGVTEAAPALRPTDAEVGAILHVPLARLLRPGAVVEEEWTIHGFRATVPFYDIDGPPVWGATAMMLAELLALFG